MDGLNWYAYASNNPLGVVDPFGWNGMAASTEGGGPTEGTESGGRKGDNPRGRVPEAPKPPTRNPNDYSFTKNYDKVEIKEYEKNHGTEHILGKIGDLTIVGWGLKEKGIGDMADAGSKINAGDGGNRVGKGDGNVVVKGGGGGTGGSIGGGNGGKVKTWVSEYQNAMSTAMTNKIGSEWGMYNGYSSSCTLMSILEAHDRNVDKDIDFDTKLTFLFRVRNKKVNVWINEILTEVSIFNNNAYVFSPLELLIEYADFTGTSSPTEYSIGWQEGYADFGTGRWGNSHSAVINRKRKSKSEKVYDPWDPAFGWPRWNNPNNIYEEEFFFKY